MKIIQYFKDNQSLFIATVVVLAVAIFGLVLIFILRKHLQKKRAYKEQLDTAKEALSNLPHSEAQNDLFLDPVLCEETKRSHEDTSEQGCDEENETVSDDDSFNDDRSDAVSVDDEIAVSTEVDVEVKEKEQAPDQAKDEQPKKEEKIQAEEKPKKFQPTRPAQKQAEKPVKYSGKWLIYVENDRYAANLVASNGEVLLRSESYSALSGVKSGIETIKNNVAKNNFAISVDKNDNFFFKLYSSSTRLLCISEGYSTKTACESAIESVKRFAKTAVIEVKKEEKPSVNEG